MSTSALRSILRPSFAGRVSAYGRRTMATGAAKKEWLAIMPDRLIIHYEGIKPLIASGTLPAGGAIFEKHPVDGEPAQFKGSIVVYSAETAEQVREIIKNDVYATSGVWDLEKVQILPYVAAVREPLTK
ncbi:hypothetical protein NW755_014448 [Fusarium falciforme]|uniref:YCII-related domain-containing protein n=1 Tax=Fusarium falciforme TaxID=195108 RepID=A0A9W8QTE2_9HYPO|nr:hypothetical protein NW755_014448 [Fusarium falciforme]